MPPIHCTPCRVTYKRDSPVHLTGDRFQIEASGVVYRLSSGLRLPENDAKLVRHEASRLRRNRNARDRAQALRDLGMTRTTSGQWE